jgi:hypothetical protein
MLHALHSLDADFDALPNRFAASASHDAPSVRERALWCAVLELAGVNPAVVRMGAQQSLQKGIG